MAFGDTPEKREGIEREAEIVQHVVEYLKSIGYIVHAEQSTFDEDTKQKIDYYLIFDPSTPFYDNTEIKIDPKAGKTYTPIGKYGNDNLKASQSDYLIKNLRGSNNYFWVSVPRLREAVKKFNPPLYKKNDASKYFYLQEFVEAHLDFFKGYYFDYEYKA